MASVSPSGSAGGIVEITNTAVAPANQFVVVSIPVEPGQRPSYAFPDGCTNITWRVRQAGIEVRFFSDIASTGYYTTSIYASGQVNTKGVTFCWEANTACDIEVAYWGPKGTLSYESVPKFVSELFTISSTNLEQKRITLTLTPDLSYNVAVTPRDGCAQFIGIDFEIEDRHLSWDGLELDSLLTVGDVLQVDYFY